MAQHSETWDEADAGLEEFKTDIMSLVADDLKAAGDAPAETQTIYHYTDVTSALAIVETGHFWFTERAHLNDTLELQIRAAYWSRDVRCGRGGGWSHCSAECSRPSNRRNEAGTCRVRILGRQL